MAEKIGEFNIKMYEGLKTIVSRGVETGVINDDARFFRVFYHDGTLNISEADPAGFDENQIKDFSDDYIDYFWTEFSMGEGTEARTVKITTFFKDFDHATGNIHVLPGNIQFWEKRDTVIESDGKKEMDPEADREKFFVVSDGITTEEDPATPYSKHAGGCVFCEEGWVPCAYDVESGPDQKMANAFYMQWDYQEHSADMIAEALFGEADIETVYRKMKSVDALKGICYNQSKAAGDTYKDVFKEVYGQKKECTGDNWNSGGGVSTYRYLKWQVYRDVREDSLTTREINIFYRNMYLEGQGYFSVYGNGVSQHLDYAEKQNSALYAERKNFVESMPEGNAKKMNKGFLVAGPNYVVEEGGKVYWILVY